MNKKSLIDYWLASADHDLRAMENLLASANKGAVSMYSKIDALNHTRFFVDLLRKNGITISRAILFGSCARDQSGKESDIDVAVVSPDFSGFRFEDLGKIAPSKLQSNPDLDVVPIAEKNFVMTDPLVREIVENGVTIT